MIVIILLLSLYQFAFEIIRYVLFFVAVEIINMQSLIPNGNIHPKSDPRWDHSILSIIDNGKKVYH